VMPGDVGRALGYPLDSGNRPDSALVGRTPGPRGTPTSRCRKRSQGAPITHFLKLRLKRVQRGRRHQGRRAVCSSFLAGNQHSFIQARLINGLTDSPERIEPPLASLTLVEEVPDSLLDQFVGAPITAASEF